MLDSAMITMYMSELEEERLINEVKKALKCKDGTKESKDLINACQEGMRQVGNLFEKGEYFIGDLIFAGELMNEVVDILKPYINEYTWKSSGKILLGTVEGDLHDIGKNIFKGMAHAAGFEVHDLGINRSSLSFIETAKKIRPNIIGLSGVLTTAIEPMTSTINLIRDYFRQDDIKIIIGGSCVNKRVCEFTGADDFTLNAAEGVEKCIKWMDNLENAIKVS